MADWSSDKMSTYPPKRSDFGLVWHFVRWDVGSGCICLDVHPWVRLRIRLTFGQVVGWLTNCSWLADWSSDKVSLVYWCKRFCQMAGWLANCSWLAGYLTKCHLCINIKDGHPQDLAKGQVDILSDDFLAEQLQLAGCLVGWPSDKMSLVYWCKRWTPPKYDLGSGWHFVRWLVGWPIAAGWLVGHLTNVTCVLMLKMHAKIWLRGQVDIFQMVC